MAPKKRTVAFPVSLSAILQPTIPVPLRGRYALGADFGTGRKCGSFFRSPVASENSAHLIRVSGESERDRQIIARAETVMRTATHNAYSRLPCSKIRWRTGRMKRATSLQPSGV
jgi:hypothetical protein